MAKNKIFHVGNVGIGTDTPTTKLQVSDASNESTISLYNAGTKKVALQASNNFGSILYSYDDEPLIFSVHSGSSFSEKVRIDSNGLMGLGVTPTSHNNTTAFQIYDDYNSVGYPRIRLTNQSSGTASSDGYEIVLNGSDLDAVHRQRENADIYFMTNNLERLRISSDGTLTKYIDNGTTAQAAFGGTGQVNGITAVPSMAGTPFVVGRDTGTNRSAHFGGNLNFNSGYGIDFSATGNGSGTMASELFDDYEEGSWTPDPHFATTGSAGETALVDGGLQGQYVKIGRLVYYTFSINFVSRDSSASGNFYVSGLPYNVSNTYWNEESGFPSAYYSGLTNSTGAPSTQPSHLDKLYFAIPSSTGNHSGNTYLNHNDIGTGNIRIRGGGIYRTAT